MCEVENHVQEKNPMSMSRTMHLNAGELSVWWNISGYPPSPTFLLAKGSGGCLGDTSKKILIPILKSVIRQYGAPLAQMNANGPHTLCLLL